MYETTIPLDRFQAGNARWAPDCVYVLLRASGQPPIPVDPAVDSGQAIAQAGTLIYFNPPQAASSSHSSVYLRFRLDVPDNGLPSLQKYRGNTKCHDPSGSGQLRLLSSQIHRTAFTRRLCSLGHDAKHALISDENPSMDARIGTHTLIKAGRFRHNNSLTNV